MGDGTAVGWGMEGQPMTCDALLPRRTRPLLSALSLQGGEVLPTPPSWVWSSH